MSHLRAQDTKEYRMGSLTPTEIEMLRELDRIGGELDRQIEDVTRALRRADKIAEDVDAMSAGQARQFMYGFASGILLATVVAALLIIVTRVL